jgi:hypothetical protein
MSSSVTSGSAYSTSRPRTSFSSKSAATSKRVLKWTDPSSWKCTSFTSGRLTTCRFFLLALGIDQLWNQVLQNFLPDLASKFFRITLIGALPGAETLQVGLLLDIQLDFRAFLGHRLGGDGDLEFVGAAFN